MRTAVGLLVGALVAALAALALGEYEFEGTMPFIAGVLLGLVIGELVVSIAGRSSVLLGAGCALLAGGSLLWAGHIDANGLEPIKTGAYVAAALGAATAYLRAGRLRTRTRSGPA